MTETMQPTSGILAEESPPEDNMSLISSVCDSLANLQNSLIRLDRAMDKKINELKIKQKEKERRSKNEN